MTRRTGSVSSLGLLLAVLAALLAPQMASGAPVPPFPIPEGPEESEPPAFIGTPAQPRPKALLLPPRHPFMARNGRSNIHNDAYMSGAYKFPGPLGRNMQRISTFHAAECASVTFDTAGRILSICVGLERPRLVMFDPQTLDKLAEFPLPPRVPTGGNPFNDFSGGGYFYLDHLDRAVIPTSHRHIWIVRKTSSAAGPGFALVRDYDVSAVTAVDDKLMSVLPDWSGRLWFASQAGVVGTIDPATGTVFTFNTGERITNSFSVDETGGVYIVTDAALYRFDASPDGEPVVTWREVYPNSGIHKPGQSGPGSGTTPDVIGSEYVAITDNADPMQVVVYRRGKDVSGSRLVCAQPVFAPGAGATDNSLITAGRSIIVENNYGYSGLTATMQGASTEPGFERVDINADGSGCTTVWRNSERAPSVVPKLSLANGLVYAYTKPPLANTTDAWYFTAIDYRTGHTVYKRLAGTGLGFNNNWAPVTLGPDGTAYVGALGGLVLLRDGP